MFERIERSATVRVGRADSPDQAEDQDECGEQEDAGTEIGGDDRTGSTPWSHLMMGRSSEEWVDFSSPGSPSPWLSVSWPSQLLSSSWVRVFSFSLNSSPLRSLRRPRESEIEIFITGRERSNTIGNSLVANEIFFPAWFVRTYICN